MAVPNYSDSAYLTMATVHGKVKRSRLADFSAVRPSGIIAISLEEDDYLGWAKLTHETRVCHRDGTGKAIPVL